MRGFQGPTSVEIVKNVKFWRGDKIVCPSVWGPVTCVRGDATSNREFAGHSTGQSLDGLHPDPPTHHHFHTHYNFILSIIIKCLLSFLGCQFDNIIFYLEIPLIKYSQTLPILTIKNSQTGRRKHCAFAAH